jgi:hypothetical protein
MRFSRRCGSGWFRRRRRPLLGKFQSGVAHQLNDRCCIQARGIVFDGQRTRRLIEAEMPDAVDVARTGQRHRHLLSGRSGVAEGDLHCRHESSIAVGGIALQSPCQLNHGGAVAAIDAVNRRFVRGRSLHFKTGQGIRHILAPRLHLKGERIR